MNNFFKLFVFLVVLLAMNFIYKINVEAGKTHKAHSHGHGNLGISIEKNEIELDYELAGEDVLGFEHKPKTDSEKATFDQVSKRTRLLFTGVKLPAGCEVKKRDFDVDYKKDHSTVEIEVDLKCQDVSKIKTLEFVVFDQFPKVQHIDVAIVTETAQKAFELTPSSTKIEL